jgi:small subunit ribosomal protein S4
MGRYTGPVCKLCRREGEKLFLKGERCHTDKCAFVRKKYRPGQHGQSRSRRSNYANQLREKQKIRSIYGILEKQFRNYFEKADHQKGVTGNNLMKLLESRLDNVIYRMGFAVSRNQARQMVNHGHFLVNDRKIDIPSYQVEPGDKIKVKEGSRKMKTIHESMQRIRGEHSLPWLILNKGKMEGVFVQVPERDQIELDVNEQLVVELYSK